MTPTCAPCPSDDAKRIECVRAGDPAAFEQVFRAYHLQLCAFAFRYLRSHAAAEDVVQEVFATLWEDRKRFAKTGSIGRFLFGAVRNRAISLLRRQIVERRWEDGDYARANMDPHSDDVTERELRYDELRQVVSAVVATLPERCGVACVLRWERQMSYAEIAEAMGIAVKTVETYLLRGTKALRACYRQRFPDG
ncbi:MAG: RNA polymerase sigma-70 factor [Gemmatimonadaceae bacterium]